MRILGIDPGIERCGWGIIEEKNGKINAISYGCIFTAKDLEMSKRLTELHDKLLSLLKEFLPEVVAMEDLFFNNNAKSAIVVGQARGVIMFTVGKEKIPLFSYSPLEIKMSITGYGRAEKEQIQAMVKNILHLKEIPKPDDTADALAVAITHSFVNKFKSKIK